MACLYLDCLSLVAEIDLMMAVNLRKGSGGTVAFWSLHKVHSGDVTSIRIASTMWF